MPPTWLSGNFALQGSFDLLDFALCQTKIRCPDNAFDLLRTARSDYSSGYCRVMQCPGDRDFAGGAAMAFADFAHMLDQAQIARQQRLLEIRQAATPVLVGKICDAFFG